MAPPITPNPDFISPYPITDADTEATVVGNGADDYDNVRYAYEHLVNKSGARLNLVGPLFHSYPFKTVQDSGDLLIQGVACTITNGSSTARMDLLDEDDRGDWGNPSGWPDGWTVLGEAPTVRFEDINFYSTRFQGYTGRQSPGGPSENIGIRGFLCFSGRYGIVNAELNAAGVANNDGTTPTALPSANPISFTLWSGPDATGTQYEPDVDFSLDAPGGTWTRLGGGAIPPGDTAYANYNDAMNRLNVTRLNGAVRRCTFTGRTRLDSTGLVKSNVQDAVVVMGSRGWGIEQDIAGVFRNTVITELADYAPLKYSLDGTYTAEYYEPSTPICGSVVVEDCVFTDVGGAATWNMGLEGRQASGPYVFPDDAAARSTMRVEDSRVLNDKVIQNRFLGFLFDFAAGLDGECLRNETSPGIGLVFFRCGPLDTLTTHLHGWVGQPNSYHVQNGGSQVAPPSERIYGASVVLRHAGDVSFDPPVASVDPVLIETCYLGFVQATGELGFNVHGILSGLEGEFPIENVTVRQCRFVNPAPTGGAAVIVGAGSTTLSECDFSEWQKGPGEVDVDLLAESYGCDLTLDSIGDLYRNAGTENAISGGTEVPA